MAIFGSFGAHRGPKMACSNLFRPKMTFPHIVIVIFSQKKEKKFFLAPTGALEEVIWDLCVCVYFMQ